MRCEQLEMKLAVQTREHALSEADTQRKIRDAAEAAEAAAEARVRKQLASERAGDRKQPANHVHRVQCAVPVERPGLRVCVQASFALRARVHP